MDRALEAEVRRGEAQELRVLRRWLDASDHIGAGARAIKSRDFQDWDFLLLDAEGFPLSFVEIKTRRESSEKYGDVIAPMRKHAFALKLLRDHKLPFVLVTEYTDALIELHLGSKPDAIKMLKRTGRPKAVQHAFWTGDSLTRIA